MMVDITSFDAKEMHARLQTYQKKKDKKFDKRCLKHLANSNIIEENEEEEEPSFLATTIPEGYDQALNKAEEEKAAAEAAKEAPVEEVKAEEPAPAVEEKKEEKVEEEKAEERERTHNVQTLNLNVAKQEQRSKNDSESAGISPNGALILFVLGIGFWWLKSTGIASESLLIGISTILFLYSCGLFLYDKKAGWVTVIAFSIWGFLYGFVLDGPVLMVSFFVAVALTSAFGIYTHSLKDTLIGGVPIILFFLSFDALMLLPDYIPFVSYSVAFASVVLNIPWYSLFSIAFLDTGGKGLFVFFKSIAWLCFVLLLVGAFVPNQGFSADAAIDLELIASQGQEYRNKYGDTPNPAYLQASCMIKSIHGIFAGKTIDTNECVRNAQVEREVAFYCEERYDKESSNYATCIEDETQLRNNEAFASGSLDRDIVEETSAEFVVDRATFPSKTTKREGQESRFPMTLEIENPFERDLEVSVSCNFRKGVGSAAESMPGIILGDSSFSFTKKSDTISRICVTPEFNNEGELAEFDGSYRIEFLAEFKGLETKSQLTRMFVSGLDSDDPLLASVKRQSFPDGGSYSSSPDEFARVNFAFGEPETNIVIEEDDFINLVVSLENLKQGRISNANFYEIDLLGDLFVSEGDFTCTFAGEGEIALPVTTSASKLIPVTSCQLELDQNMINKMRDQELVIASYDAIFNYDYELSHEESVTFNLLKEESEEEVVVS